ncbi:MAG TPA: large conductance mechanosensitive channel protein MscL [Fimbriimonadaceae bacterium]|nr:large conductance mechanosensitive channel protein MscL [Fimbriimonadaceae bacterium]
MSDKPPKKTLFQEFRDFSIKGNVIDLTVGVIIGAAFTKIVNSIVEDLVMPPLGVLLGKVDFTNLFVLLPGQEDKIAKAGKPLQSLADYKAAGVATFAYGNFINNVVQFLIVAVAVFLMVRSINRLRERFGEPPPTPIAKRPCPFCISDIPQEATRCPFCTSELVATQTHKKAAW